MNFLLMVLVKLFEMIGPHTDGVVIIYLTNCLCAVRRLDLELQIWSVYG